MTDQRAVRIHIHRTNLERYGRLLAGNPTDVEQKFLHVRITEERLALEGLQQEGGFESGTRIIATQAVEI